MRVLRVPDMDFYFYQKIPTRDRCDMCDMNDIRRYGTGYIKDSRDMRDKRDTVTVTCPDRAGIFGPIWSDPCDPRDMRDISFHFLKKLPQDPRDMCDIRDI